MLISFITKWYHVLESRTYSSSCSVSFEVLCLESLAMSRILHIHRTRSEAEGTLMRILFDPLNHKPALNTYTCLPFSLFLFGFKQLFESYTTSGIFYHILPWALPIAQVSYALRARNKSIRILLSRTHAGPGRTVNQKQEDILPNHVLTIISGSVYETVTMLPTTKCSMYASLWFHRHLQNLKEGPFWGTAL